MKEQKLKQAFSKIKKDMDKMSQDIATVRMQLADVTRKNALDSDIKNGLLTIVLLFFSRLTLKLSITSPKSFFIFMLI